MEVLPKDPVLKFHPDTLEAIRKMYNLDEGRMAQSVDILEEWAKKQNHFTNKRFDRGYYERTIVACKGSVEKAKAQIDKMCTLRTLLPKYFISSNVREKMKDINGIAKLVTLPKMTKEYQRVFLVKINDRDISPENFLDYYRLNFVMAEYLKAHDYVNGFVIVDDFRDANFMELTTKMNFIEFQHFMTILMEGFGAKLKGIHILSHSKLVDIFVKSIKAMVPAKISKRFYLYSTLEELHAAVDKEILPVDLGGDEKSIEELQGDWLEVLSSKEHEKYLEVMKTSCTDESLRQTGKFNEQYMGLPGSFRTLNVD